MKELKKNSTHSLNEADRRFKNLAVFTGPEMFITKFPLRYVRSASSNPVS
jgi:hypothetical protein